MRRSRIQKTLLIHMPKSPIYALKKGVVRFCTTTTIPSDQVTS